MCGTRGTFFKDKRRGAVLILVLFVLTGLSVLTVEFNRDILLDHAMSTSTRSILAAKPLMESGERLATAVLTRNSEAGTRITCGRIGDCSASAGTAFRRTAGADLSAPSRTKTAAFPSTPFSTNARPIRCPCRGSPTSSPGCWPGFMRVHGYAGGPDNASRLPKSTWIRSVNGAGRRKRTKTP